MLDRNTYTSAKVVDLAKKLVPCKQDAASGEPAKVAEKFKVDAVPTILFVDAKGKEVHRFEGHRGAVTALAFTPDGHTLISGSRDSTALVWDMTSIRAR